MRRPTPTTDRVKKRLRDELTSKRQRHRDNRRLDKVPLESEDLKKSIGNDSKKDLRIKPPTMGQPLITGFMNGTSYANLDDPIQRGNERNSANK